MESILLPFVLQRKCSVSVDKLKEMKMLDSIKLNNKLSSLVAKNNVLKEQLIEEIEEDIPREENRNKLINLKRDIFNDRYRFVNKSITLNNHEIEKKIHEYQESTKEMLKLKDDLKKKFNEEYNFTRVKMQEIYKENKELVSGLKHISLSAYEKIDKYINTPADNHTTSYRKFDRTLAKVMTRAALKPSPFSTFTKVGISILGNVEKEDNTINIIKLEINDTFILRLFSNYLKLPEVMVNCNFALEDKLALDRECISIIYEYDKNSNSKVFETSSRYIRLPYKGGIKVLYDTLKDKESMTLKDIAAAFDEEVDNVKFLNFILKCEENGLIKCLNKLDASKEDVLIEAINKIKTMSPKDSKVCNRLLVLLESLNEYRNKYNLTDNEAERAKYFKLIESTIEKCYETINYKCKLENLVYEDYIDKNLSFTNIDSNIIEDLNKLCSISTIFDINFRTQLYFASMFKLLFQDKAIEYKNDRIMMLLTEATKKYSELWTEEWKVLDDSETNEDIVALDKKKKEFLDYLISNKDKDEIIINDEFIDSLRKGLPEYLLERESSMDFFIQKLNDGKVVINDIYPGYLTFISRFLDYFDDEELLDIKNQYIEKVFNNNYKVAEIYEIYGFNANRHKPISNNRLVFDSKEESADLFKNNINVKDVKLLYNEKTHRVDFLDGKGEVFYPKHIGSLITILMKGEHAFVNNLGTNVLTLPTLYKAFATEKITDIITIPRIMYNNLLLSRKMWIVPIECIPEKKEDMELQEYFFMINEWIKKVKIPPSCYIKVEKKVERNNDYSTDYSANKPQYIDFKNSVLVQLFDNMIKGCSVVKFEEAKPDYVEENLGDSAEEYVVEITNMRRS